MSAITRANGWHGFTDLGEPVKGGHRYQCVGMPTQMGCGNEIVLPRRLARVGLKKSGWLVCYGLDFDGTIDEDVVLVFCPSCAAPIHDQTKEDLR